MSWDSDSDGERSRRRKSRDRDRDRKKEKKSKGSSRSSRRRRTSSESSDERKRRRKPSKKSSKNRRRSRSKSVSSSSSSSSRRRRGRDAKARDRSRDRDKHSKSRDRDRPSSSKDESVPKVRSSGVNGAVRAEQAVKAEAKPSVNAVMAIEEEGFTPRAFVSSRTKRAEPVVVDLEKNGDSDVVEVKKEAVKVEIDFKEFDPEGIVHPNMFADPAEKEARWIKRLISLRQRFRNV